MALEWYEYVGTAALVLWLFNVCWGLALLEFVGRVLRERRDLNRLRTALADLREVEEAERRVQTHRMRKWLF